MPAQKQGAAAHEPGKGPAHEKYQRLVDDCKTLPPTPTAVVHPCDQSSLQGAVDAARMGLIAPILVGPRARIEEVARQNKIDISGSPSSTRPLVMPPRAISVARRAAVSTPMVDLAAEVRAHEGTGRYVLFARTVVEG